MSEKKPLNDKEMEQPTGGSGIWFKPVPDGSLTKPTEPPPTAVWIGGSIDTEKDTRIRDTDL